MSKLIKCWNASSCGYLFFKKVIFKSNGCFQEGEREQWVQAMAALLTPDSPQQQAELARRAQTQEEKLAAALRVELHNTSCQIQSLQAETESLRALVSRPGTVLAFPVSSLTLNCLTVVIWVSHLTARESFEACKESSDMEC